MAKYLKANIFSSNSAYRALVYLAVGTVIGGGVVFGYGSNRTAGRSNDNFIAANFTGVELQAGCIAANSGSGACLQVISGVTNDHSIFTKSGSLVTGPLASPKFLATNTGSTTATRLEVNRATAGSGGVKAVGSDGGAWCAADSDGSGYTQCSYNNGAQTCASVTNCSF